MNETPTTATVKRHSAPSGNRDHDYFQPTCPCGWTGAMYSNRTVEGRRLAAKHAAEHRCPVSDTPDLTPLVTQRNLDGILESLLAESFDEDNQVDVDGHSLVVDDTSGGTIRGTLYSWDTDADEYMPVADVRLDYTVTPPRKPQVGDLADHKSGRLDPRPVAAVSDDGTAVKIQIGSTVSDWFPADNYRFTAGGDAA